MGFAMLLQRYFHIFRRWLWLIALAVLLATVASNLWSRTLPLIYATSTKLLIDPGSSPLIADTYSAQQTAESLVKTYAEMVKTRPILERAAQRLQLPMRATDLEPLIRVTTVRQSPVLEIGAEYNDPVIAKRLVDAVSEGFIAEITDRYQARLQASRDMIGQRLQQVTAEIDRRAQMIGQLRAQRNEIRTVLKDITDRRSDHARVMREVARLDVDLELRRQAQAAQQDPALRDIAQREINEMLASRTRSLSEADRLTRELEERQPTLEALRAWPTATGNSHAELDLDIERLNRELGDLQATRVSLQQTFEGIGVADARVRNSVITIEPAPLPVTAVRPRVLLNTMLGGALGLLLAIVVVVVAQFLDDRVFTPEELNAAVGLSTLAVIGRFPPRVRASMQLAASIGSVGTQPPIPLAQLEAYRVLRTNLRFEGREGALKVILIASARPGEGKSMTSFNLAAALAEAGFSTILVDADLRRPSLHIACGVPNDRGLSNVLIGGNAESLLLTTAIPNLRILPSGQTPPNPSDMLASQRLPACLAKLRTLVDYVIVDTSPVLAVPDALALAPHTDGVVLVVHARDARAGQVRRAREAFERVGAPVLGTVLNSYPHPSTAYYAPPERPRTETQRSHRFPIDA
jgi:capsular exopolysaccharide synthesis family protein